MLDRRPVTSYPRWLLMWLSLVLVFLGMAPARAVFEERTATNLPAVQSDSYGFATLDVNGDDYPDLVVAQAGQPRLLVNTGDGHFIDQSSQRLPVLEGITTVAVAVGDVDGDGHPDLVLATSNAGIRLLLNDGNGVFTDQSNTRLPALPPQVSMAVVLVDVNGDGALDIVVANRYSQNRLLLNNGQGVFQDVSSTALPPDADPSDVVVAFDADGDGVVDLFIGNEDGQNRLLLNNRQGIFIEQSAGRLPAVAGSTLGAVAVDVDGDGAQDLVLAAGTAGVRLLLNDGQGHFTEASGRLPGLSDFAIRVAAGDLDDDGAVDLVVANAGQDRVLLNDGTGRFTEATATWLPVNDSRSFGLLLADLNADRTLDWVIATPQAQDRLLMNLLPYPRLQLSLTPTYLEVGTTATFTVDAFDEHGLSALSLVVSRPDSQQDAVPLSGGTGVYQVPLVGAYTAVATAVNTLGSSGSRRLPFKVVAADTTAPTVTLQIAAPTPLLLGQTVTLTVTAHDDRAVVATRLTVNGTPVPVDRNGQATYIPGSTGVYSMVAEAQDAAGNVGRQTGSFTVGSDNQAPQVSIAVTPNPVELTKPVAITVISSDNVRVASLTATLSGPGLPVGGQVLALDATGHGSYTPYQPGTYTVTVQARDPAGNETVQTATFEAVGVPDTTPPQVSIAIVPRSVIIGKSTVITVNATDNVGVTALTLEINGTPVVLTGNSVTYTPPVIGDYTATATARDATGNVTVVSGTFQAVDPTQDTTPPVVQITAPPTDTEVTAPVTIIGTVTDATLVNYTLAYSVRGANAFTPFATGDQEVTNGVLGTLDPSLLLNDLYDIRLTAVDVNGRTSATTVVYQVRGDLKVGNFTLAFQDLNIPVAGIPITISRLYDSRDKGSHDFGFGWNLELQTIKVRKSGVLGENWTQNSDGGFIPTYCLDPVGKHYVSVILPDGRTEEFDMTVDPRCQLLYPIQDTSATFIARPGTTSQLEALDGADLLLIGSELVTFDTLLPYDPQYFRLTTAEGMVFEFSQNAGLSRVIDPSGNTLNFGPNGIIHSAGKSVIFSRDAQQRITRITDPNGATINYDYDAHGDLVAVTDQAGQVTQYHYNNSHGLVDIIDPRGVTATRNLYDDAGRLIATVDANGNRTDYTHDIEGRQEIVRNRRGYVTLYVYDNQGNILGKTDALGQTTTYIHDDRGNELSLTDPLGHTTTHTYDDRDNMLTETDPLGNTVKKTYNNRNQPLTQTDARGNTTTYAYDANGRLIATTDPLGNVTSSSYDAQGNRIVTTDGAGNVFKYGYDASGRQVARIDALGHKTAYTFDADGNQLTESTTRTDSNGTSVNVVTSRSYDALNRVIQETDAEGHVTRTEYNSAGKEAAVTDKNGNRTAYDYDASRKPVLTRYTDGTQETAAYDAEGNRISSTDRAGRTTHYQYDALNRLILTTYPDGSTARVEYDAAGREVARTDENGHRTVFEYDASGKRTQAIDTAGNVTTYTRDANGNLLNMTDGNGHTTTYEYDALNHRTRTVFPDGTASSVTYDKVGRRIAETDQAGITTTFQYDGMGHLVKVVNAVGGATTYAYDELGNKIVQTDANGHVTRWTYDNLGQVTSRTLPEGMTETFAYDPNGNMLNHKDFNGGTTAFEYDVNNRLTRKVYPNGSDVRYTYTATGQVQTLSDSRGVTRYSYDVRDRLLRVDNPDGTWLVYTYDAAGNRTSVETPAGTTTYSYDALNRLSTVTDPSGGMTAYGYDAVGNRLSVTYPNGTEAHYTYDALNRLTRLENRRADDSLISSYSYSLGPTGNRTRVVEPNGRQVDYTYDKLYRLVSEDSVDPVAGNSHIEYSYDAVGNRLTKTTDGQSTAYAYDDNDRLLTGGGTVYSYDSNGNLIKAVEGSRVTSYTYDFENRLLTVATPSDTASYTYDADGIRMSATFNGALTDYLVDKNRDFAQVLEERGQDGSLQVRYTYGDDLIAQQRNGVNAYYHYDGLGSTRALTNDAQVTTDTYTYDAFGNLLNSSGTTVNTYLFAGQQYDSLAGGYYLRARYYHQATGRFMTMDSFEGYSHDPLSLHKYLYVKNNPVNLVDPSGNQDLASLDISISISIELDSIALPSFGAFLKAALDVGIVIAKAAVIACAAGGVISAVTAVGSGNPCDVTHFNILYPGSDTPQTTIHITTALAMNPSWAALDRIKPPNSRSWLRTDPRCLAKKSGEWCDEYPFASSAQGGGPWVSVQPVPGWEQSLQGGKLSAFYFACNIKPNDPIDGAFGVVPTGGPTFWVCK